MRRTIRLPVRQRSVTTSGFASPASSPGMPAFDRESEWVRQIWRRRRATQPRRVPGGRGAEQPVVFPTELRRTFITDRKADPAGIGAPRQQQAPSLLQPDLLLELQGAHV